MNQSRYYHDRITMALDDLLRCQSYCEMMLKLPIGEVFSNERTLYESLFVSSIVTYGRVLTTSNTVEKVYKASVSNDFGKFRQGMLQKQNADLVKFHDRIIEKRDTAIAHSDAKSRDYRHYGDSPVSLGSNPYYPSEHSEVMQVIELVNNFIVLVSYEQVRVGEIAFN